MQGDVVPAEAFGHRPGQVIPEGRDVDAVVDGLLNGIPRLRVLLLFVFLRIRAHDEIVAVVPAHSNRPWQSAWAGNPLILRGCAGRVAASKPKALGMAFP